MKSKSRKTSRYRRKIKPKPIPGLVLNNPEEKLPKSRQFI